MDWLILAFLLKQLRIRHLAWMIRTCCRGLVLDLGCLRLPILLSALAFLNLHNLLESDEWTCILLLHHDINLLLPLVGEVGHLVEVLLLLLTL